MSSRSALALAAIFATAIVATACNRDTATPPKPKTDSLPGKAGGPGATSGGIKGDATGGTPGGAATASTPQGPAPGAGISRTEQDGLASRPTERPAGKD